MTDDHRVRRALEMDDLAGLRRLADAGNHEAVQALLDIAAERADIPELRRLAATGNVEAAAILEDLTDD